MMILSQAAPFDMATTSGIAQSVTLRFVDGAGAAKDISSHEFRCAVRGPGAAAIKCEPVDANTALLSWSPLKAGTHAYDLFMTSPDGAERPLIKGEIHAASRVTPPGSEDVVTIGDVKIMIPDAAEGEVKIIDPSVDAAERAESAAQEASNARNDAQNAKKEAEKSAESATTSATAAQQALEAMPQVDASGNMTLPGGLTAAGAVNANGGINIPLAVGAPTDTSAVNFFYAMGLAGAVQALIQPLYLKTSSMPVVGAGTTSVQYAGLYATSSTSAASGSPAHSTTTFTFEGPQDQHNYSSFAGFSIPLSGSTASKFTFGLGRGSKTVRGGLTMDSFSMIPGNNLAVNYGEIIDITTTAVRDAVRGGYVLRVREIYYVSSGDSWQVKTTESFIPATQNHPFPACLNRLIFMQEGLSSMSSYEGKASLYIELGGGQTNTLFKIAALRGVSGFEDGMGFSTLVADVENPNSWTSSVRTGAGSRYLYANGLRNPMYAALEAMAINAIESEETADFEDINETL
ncbi:MAG: cell envelope integrity protein TolA [Akkermansia muciniphila]